MSAAPNLDPRWEALAGYIGRGWPILRLRGKVPAVKPWDGCTARTVADIAPTFPLGGAWNAGLRLDLLPTCLVADFDLVKHPDCAAEFATRTGVDVTDDADGNMRVQTGSRAADGSQPGRHLYFLVDPEEVAANGWKSMDGLCGIPGVDVKVSHVMPRSGERAQCQVVLPGSKTDGEYRFASDVRDPQPLPDWYRNFLNDHFRKPKAAEKAKPEAPKEAPKAKERKATPLVDDLVRVRYDRLLEKATGAIRNAPSGTRQGITNRAAYEVGYLTQHLPDAMRTEALNALESASAARIGPEDAAADDARKARGEYGDVERAFRDGQGTKYDTAYGDPIVPMEVPTAPRKDAPDTPDETDETEAFRPTTRLRRLSDVGEPLPVEWLEGDIAHGRIPRGEYSILFGEPGVGKGSITAQIVAQVTQAGRAVIVSAPEDDLHRVTLPRYMAAGADMSLVIAMDYQVSEDDYEPVDIRAQAPEILDAARSTNAAMIVLDPLEEHLRADAKSERETRVAFGALLRGCRELGTVLWGVDHPNRMTTQSVYQKAGGSSAKYKLARSVLYAGRQATPDEEQTDTTKRVALLHAKTNMGATARGLLFEVGSEYVQTSSGPVSTGFARMLGATSLTIEELLSEKALAIQSDTGAAAGWLRDYLGQHGGGMIAEEAEKAAKATNPDWTRQVLKAAVISLGGKYAPMHGGGPWGYRLADYRPLGEDRPERML